MIADAQPLTVHAVPAYLVRRGILPGLRPEPEVDALDGGVSGRVFRVRSISRDLVVKQALERLATEDDWHADPARILVEARAMTALHALTPEHVPELIDADADTDTIVMSAAPSAWCSWKDRLLGPAPQGPSDPAETANTIAGIVAVWHSSSLSDAEWCAPFADTSLFETLRLTPFHRSVREKHPQAAPAVDDCIDELTGEGLAFVHGDLSPKNILIGDDSATRLWVIDYEVAHIGQPVFDLAFMNCHLLLKTVHLPERREALVHARDTFLTSYLRGAAPVLHDPATRRLGAHTACLLLARVDGTSPATYLTADERSRVRHIALDVLTSSDPEAAFVDRTHAEGLA